MPDAAGLSPDQQYMAYVETAIADHAKAEAMEGKILERIPVTQPQRREGYEAEIADLHRKTNHAFGTELKVPKPPEPPKTEEKGPKKSDA